jgi:rhodanese-related sulfurtransferase
MKRLNASGGLPPRSSGDANRSALDALHRGAQVIDVRTPAEFAAGHLRGALNLPAGKSLLGWAGSVVDPDRELVFIATPASRHAAEEAARALPLIGYDRVSGVLAPDDVATLSSTPLDTLPTIRAASLGPAAGADATIVDVRNRTEWQAGHVPGAVHIPLAELPSRLEELRGHGPLLVHCQGGSRSAVGASVLRAAGFDDVSNVAGGYAAWVAAGNAPSTDA